VASFALSVDVAEEDAELLALLLWDAGASGLEVRDSEAPPMPGVRGPASGEAILVAGFPLEREAEEAKAHVQEAYPRARVRLERLQEEDWSLAWRARIRSTRVGRLWVGPPWESPPPDAISLHVEPKMAFGTGDHPTTALCLAALDDYLFLHPEASVLDVGTGTGVLALLARKLGASRVVGVDTDRVSLELARENAEVNGVWGVELSMAPLSEVQGRFDLVLANILANTLVALAPLLEARTGRTLVLAGVLRHQADDVAGAFLALGLVRMDTAFSGEWARLTFGRGPT
jgi:ribosomal protein L11 methyltransferase